MSGVMDSNQDQNQNKNYSTDLTTITSDVVSISQLRAKMSQMTEMLDLKRQFLKDNLKEGIDKDYATIPGCGEKKVLLKPGAEKLLEWHGYYPTFTLTAEKEDYDKGIFSYVYRCEIKQKGLNICLSDCEGDASTHESKYRFEWKYENQIPAGIDKASLKTRTVGANKTVQYQMLLDNPADKRNTIRKMAQKRALMGATVLATATSDLFSTEEPPDDNDIPSTGNNDNTKTSTKSASKDYGSVISEKQAKRLYAIRKSAEIDTIDFNDWLESNYGIKSDREIGFKIYEKICKVVETGRLTPIQDEDDNASKNSNVKSDPNSVISVSQIKDLSMMINNSPIDDKEFSVWLGEYDSFYDGKNINNIKVADYDEIVKAFVKSVDSGVFND